MRSFPEANPGTPDVGGPWRYMAWAARNNWRSLTLASLWNALWVGAQALTPAAIGQAINAGLVGRDQTALVWWGMAVLGAGVVQAVTAMLAERAELTVRVGSGYQTLQFVNRQVCDLGATVGRRVSAGDLVTVGVSDINLIGQSLEIGARGVGGAAGFIVVAVLMLTASWQVGLLVLGAVPVILLVTTRLSRLLRERQGQVRAQQRELTDQSVDIVRGLRVLRGFGGESIFAKRYRDGSQKLRFIVLKQARASALLGATRTFLPGMLLVGVVTLAAELVLDRQLSAGQMVAFYGYAAFLVSPITRMTYAVSKAMQAHVAAENITRLLRMKPDIEPGQATAGMPAPSALVEPVSGLTIPAHGLTAVVCDAADAAGLSDRLGRYTAETQASYGTTPLADLPLAGVRERILVTPGDAHLFSGRLREELDPVHWSDQCTEPESDDKLWQAIDAAAARDIIEALPDQLDATRTAHEFSGGQQQRLRLVRALMADPEVLILIDPTSAVDAHTESKMAEGIARLRDGRATVVFTTSILVLHQADRVALVIDGKVAAEGSHETLMNNQKYRALVERGMAIA